MSPAHARAVSAGWLWVMALAFGLHAGAPASASEPDDDAVIGRTCVDDPRLKTADDYTKYPGVRPKHRYYLLEGQGLPVCEDYLDNLCEVGVDYQCDRPAHPPKFSEPQWVEVDYRVELPLIRKIGLYYDRLTNGGLITSKKDRLDDEKYLKYLSQQISGGDHFGIERGAMDLDGDGVTEQLIRTRHQRCPSGGKLRSSTYVAVLTDDGADVDTEATDRYFTKPLPSDHKWRKDPRKPLRLFLSYNAGAFNYEGDAYIDSWDWDGKEALENPGLGELAYTRLRVYHIGTDKSILRCVYGVMGIRRLKFATPQNN